MRSFSIFGVFFILYCNECTMSVELLAPTFIYDNTWCPENELDAQLNEIIRFTSNFSSCAIDTGFVTIWVNSGRRSKVTEISNSTITPINDQKALYRLLHLLERSPPYYAIYVMTFATKSWDEGLVEKILEQIQIKRSQVNFFIWGEYPSEVDYLKEYRLISSISNGITRTSFELNPFTDCMSTRLNSIPIKANLLTVYGTGNGTYCMKTDSLLRTNLEDMIYSNFDSNEYDADVTISRKYDRTTKSRIQEVCVEVRRKSQNPSHASSYTLRGFSESDFDFNYGFSADNVTLLNKAYTRPVRGISNKIYVSPCLENTPYGFDHFRILFINGTSSAEEIPLELIPNTDLFVGSFEPPEKEYFYIQVTTYADGEKISRMSSIAMNAADGFGEDKQNPTIGRKPTEHRRYYIPRPPTDHLKVKPIIQQNPESSESEYRIDITIALYCAIVILLLTLIVLLFILPKSFWRDCLSPGGSGRRREAPEPLGIEKARRRAVPNNYLIMMPSKRV
ncbi:hemicentin-1-like [Planococcus citri]|uniref:hemicentin-1-like n=1 Tax=Planococcus citri TaxID=170843 RepID=UPI0031F7799F